MTIAFWKPLEPGKSIPVEVGCVALVYRDGKLDTDVGEQREGRIAASKKDPHLPDGPHPGLSGPRQCAVPLPHDLPGWVKESPDRHIALLQSLPVGMVQGALGEPQEPHLGWLIAKAGGLYWLEREAKQLEPLTPGMKIGKELEVIDLPMYPDICP